MPNEPKHDYETVLLWWNHFGPSDAVDAAETIRHALTQMQLAQQAVPPGVDPVKVLQGLAGEPSEELIDLIVNAPADEPSRTVAAWNFYEARDQLYREASEGAGE